MKLQLTCSECSFVAFVDSRNDSESAGWRLRVLEGRNAVRGICPACIREQVPVSALRSLQSAPKSKTA